MRLAAAYDFVFGESDRHGQNVMLHESGMLTLIDNENFHSAATNSMFLPGACARRAAARPSAAPQPGPAYEETASDSASAN